jgi:hypothetical protein
MSYTSLFLVLSFFLSFSPVVAVAQEETAPPKDEYLLKPLSESVQVQTKCGQFFGYNLYTGVTEKCISFNYQTDTNLFIRTVSISTIMTEIDNDKEEPTVLFTSPSQILIRISQAEYDKEKECLPAPKEKEQQ